MFESKINLFDVEPDEEFGRNAKENQTSAGGNSPFEDTLNANHRALLRALKDSSIEKTECFGGVLFQWLDENTMPVLSFVVKGMDDAELSAMKKAYQKLYQSGLSRLISRAYLFGERVGEYTVFNFDPISGCRSLRDYCKTNQNIPVEVMFGKLVRILVERYKQFYQRNTPYESLNCLSLDTIFVDADGSLWLLPLRAFGNCYPREIPPEAHDPTQKCDETSDLCAAAYVAVEVANGGRLPEMLCLQDSKIKDCLMMIPQCRPSLKTIAELYNRRSASGGVNTGERSGPSADKASSKSENTPIFGNCKAWAVNAWNALKRMFNREPQAERNRTQKMGTWSKLSPINQDDETDEGGL